METNPEIEKAIKDRPWTNEFYYQCAFLWKDKIPELKQRVKEIEAKTQENQLNNENYTKN